MFDYDQQLKKFYERKIKLPPDMRSMLLDHRKANADRLIARLGERSPKICIGEANFRSQGSFAMNTVIQTRFVNEEYDIDYGVVIRRSQLKNKDGSEMTAQEVREMVRDALKDDRFKRQPKIMSNCVRVFYADEDDYAHHVDIPVYREYEDDNGKTITELAGQGGWCVSNPTRVNEWLETVVKEKNEQSEDSGSQMRRMIKWLKRFCRSRNAETDTKWDLPNGMKLTMLIVECFCANKRDDTAFYDTLVALKNRLVWNLEIENLADTGCPRAKLTKSKADQNVLNLRARIGEALESLIVLFQHDCDEPKARRAWDWVFQSDGFLKEQEDEAKDEAKRQALLEKAAILSTGNAGTDCAGRIVTVSTAAVPNIAHAFYGDSFHYSLK
ncbi:hypothetical protein M2103_000568 [Ereboglobus sp. PH5-5]|uniref:cyclic GMP-AMP synthase DncV-like nucleotidyltransferase n=1 Tax=Ereboglobus sp. PH5-5 TaxID=2940529 RepID=UPI002405F3E4|nr:hypothetical protein [Ereboglobus sp. PH5-5]MDF9832358.1 hypothetical protein [Ereboglobus sp. PH5-5]